MLLLCKASQLHTFNEIHPWWSTSGLVFSVQEWTNGRLLRGVLTYIDKDYSFPARDPKQRSSRVGRRHTTWANRSVRKQFYGGHCRRPCKRSLRAGSITLRGLCSRSLHSVLEVFFATSVKKSLDKISIYFFCKRSLCKGSVGDLLARSLHRVSIEISLSKGMFADGVAGSV